MISILPPGNTTPDSSATAITPALRINAPSADRSSTAANKPGMNSSIWLQGLRRPVIFSTASDPMRSSVQADRFRSGSPVVVMFSPI
jgi:hypothetical protein